LCLPSRKAGHHGDRQYAQLLGDLGHHRRCARAGAAAHAGGDEQHVAALDELHDAVAILHRRLPPDLGIGARAESLGDVATDLQCRLDLGMLERLRVGMIHMNSTPSMPLMTM